ncbi:aminotransferase class I/II-fold pyridoxal phosphate-dependent enzyme [Cytobacillus praedii]|uniref:aminotransferase class I/II-fold pyridoxal phosphate-dependent enzyme n=1 Tax=Cytobacillus praedii TaxID=1742358 RepID=UPI000BA66F11|nr:aminotransferase class I/II-fold pyridoxal phosphate-dependent enzyme [Cytobacillus praedii]
MITIPFLKPNVVKKESYLHYLSKIDENKIYTNYGPLNSQFEKRILEEYFKGKGNVTTVNNATMGLILSIAELKRPQAKYAIMPSFTFSATPLAAMWCGLEPYFIDVDKETWLMDEEKLVEALNLLGNEVAIVVPYATFGSYLRLSFYNQLQETGIPVVIDAAPCFGTTYGDIHIGENFQGSIVFSFHATKSFGIGEGGLVYSQDSELIQRIKTASNFGYYGTRESISLGINSKLSEYHAAIGLATLDVYQVKIQKRQKIYEFYLEEINNYRLLEKGWEIQKTVGSIPYQFFAILCPKGKKNRKYVEKLEKSSIMAVSYYNPSCHQQHQFQNYLHSELTVTNELTDRILCLPFWEDMNNSIVKRVIKALIS